MGYPDFQETNTLAQLISNALAAAGIPVIGNPVPRYNISTPTPNGNPGPQGVSAFGGGGSEADDITAYQAQVGRNMQACRVYFQDDGTDEIYASALDFPDDLSAAFQLGLVAAVSYKPPFSGTTGPSNLPSPAQMTIAQNNMIASLQSIIACGFPAASLRVIMWHEANFQAHGISAAQYLNLYSGVASSGKSNYTALHAICPVVSIMLGNQPPTSHQITTYPPIVPTLATNACDELWIDWYAKPYTQGEWLGGPVPAGQTTWDAVARTAGVKLGLGEFGGLNSQPIGTVVKYLLSGSITIGGVTYAGDPDHSMQAVMGGRLADNLSNG